MHITEQLHCLSNNAVCIFHLCLMLADMSMPGQLGKVVASARATFIEGRSRYLIPFFLFKTRGAKIRSQILRSLTQ